MSRVQDLETLQLDALREVANIGAGHAATALSRLTDRRIMISIPAINVASAHEIAGLLGDPETPVVAIQMPVLGDLTGQTILLLPTTDARLLCDLMLGRPAGATEAFKPMEESSLKEAGNILGGAYLNALSDFMGMMLLPHVPTLIVDRADAILDKTVRRLDPTNDLVLYAETQFFSHDANQPLVGHFVLLPNKSSIEAIFHAIRIY